MQLFKKENLKNKKKMKKFSSNKTRGLNVKSWFWTRYTPYKLRKWSKEEKWTHKTKQEQNYFKLVSNHKKQLCLFLPEEGRGKKPIQPPLQKTKAKYYHYCFISF